MEYDGSMGCSSDRVFCIYLFIGLWVGAAMTGALAGEVETVQVSTGSGFRLAG